MQPYNDPSIGEAQILQISIVFCTLPEIRVKADCTPPHTHLCLHLRSPKTIDSSLTRISTKGRRHTHSGRFPLIIVAINEAEATVAEDAADNQASALD